MAHVGSGRTPVKLGVERKFNKRRRVPADARVPCRSIIQILGERVVAAELEAARKRPPHIHDKRVIRAHALGNPRGRVGEIGIRILRARRIEGRSIGEISRHRLVHVFRKNLVVAVRSNIANGQGGARCNLLLDAAGSR